MAHASEQAFVLLLPTGFYTVGGTMAVVLSIVLVSILKPEHLRRAFQAYALSMRLPLSRAVVSTSCVAALGVFGLIYVGFAGPNDPQRNLLPLSIWTMWWVGLFVIQALVLDIWRWLNPWAGPYALLVGRSRPPLRLPGRVGQWPAVVVFLATQSFAFSDVAPSDPDRLAAFVMGYWIFTFAGMLLFGRRPWLSQVECFSVLFNWIGHMRPVQTRGGLRIGVPGWHGLQSARPALGGAFFCLLVLGAGSFDGLKETFWWMAQIGVNPLEFPGRSAVVVSSAVGFVLGILALLLAYMAAVAIGVAALPASERVPFARAFCAFAISILPLAVGYHVGHYLVSFMVQSQYFLAALADPLARGWTLFGLQDVRVTTGFLNTQDSVRLIWLAQAGAIVGAHILSVVMAHHVASQMTRTRRGAALLQLGLSLLMIAYTVFGLWLLAAPRGA